MFFTKLGTIAAWVALIMATTRIGLALYIIFGISDPEQASTWTARYLGVSNLGVAIDQAAMVAAFAIALGILAEISKTLRRGQ